jgi:hypothetical protein
MRKPTHKKTHSCKPLQTNAETKACKRVFFSPAGEEFQNIFSNASKKLKHPTRKLTMQTADTYGHDNWTTETEAHAHNTGSCCTTPF